MQQEFKKEIDKAEILVEALGYMQKYEGDIVVALSIRLPSLRVNTSRRFAYIDVTSKEDARYCVEKLNGLKIEG